MRKISVAVLLSGKEQFSVYYGGALARWTYEVYSRLRDHLDVTVFGFPTDPASAYPLAHRTPSIWRACAILARTPLLRRYEDHAWLRALLPGLRDFDLVHIHNRPQWVPLLRSLGYDRRIVLHLQNDHLGHWNPAALDQLATDLDGVVACSNYLASQSSRHSKALARKTKVVFNGVDTSLFQPKPDVREPRTIFFIGSFIPAKGPLQLMQAYELVLRRHADAKLVVGGSTSFGKHEETEYVREVRGVGDRLKRRFEAAIEFPGYIHHDRDLPAFFQRATIFTSPSIFQEPFGLVNAEAMASATAVVGSNRGGIPEVIGDCGLLIDPENIAEYADALLTLLNDPLERTRLASAALDRVRRMFDWKIIAETWLAYLKQTTDTTVGCLECA